MENNKTVTIHDLARAGSGVAKLETGEILFVPFTAPGDEIEAKVLESKKSYKNGELVKILKPSKARVTPKCSVFTVCGGCSWQHLPYDLQFETKKKGLFHTLKRGGVDVTDIPVDDFPAKNEYQYRNRIQLRGNVKSKQIGFYQKNSREIVPIEQCPIADYRINEALPALAKEGFASFPEEFKLEVEVMPSGEVRAIWNEANAALGFRQINDEQNEVLQKWVKKHIKKTDLLFDLYGGFGNLSLPLAQDFKEVYCIDSSVPKGSEARAPANYHFEKKDIRPWAKTLYRSVHTDLKASFIIDPPREGMGPFFDEIAKKMSKIAVQSVILVGCDVDSFVKDTARLIKAGYKLERLGVLDLFPQTPHVESLALFSK